MKTKLIAWVAVTVLSSCGWAGVAIGYHHKFDITLCCTNQTALADFPVPVRLSSAIAGFDYADFSSSAGNDLLFTDAEGTVALPHEIETWNAAGESVVWVKVPSLVTNGVITCWYGKPSVAQIPPSAESERSVWSSYFAVLHMRKERAGFDSTGLGLELEANTADEKDGNLVTRYTDNGLLGGCWFNEPDTRGCMSISNVVFGKTAFTISGWLKPNKLYNASNARVFSAKKEYNKNGGFEYLLSSDRVLCRGNGSNATFTHAAPFVSQQLPIDAWRHVTAVFNGTTAKDYYDGVLMGSGTIETVSTEYTANAERLGLGCAGGKSSDNGDNLFGGYMDEVRIRSGESDAAWVAAEFASMSRTDFLAFGAVGFVESSVPEVIERPVVSYAGGTVTVSGVVSAGSGEVFVRFGDGERVSAGTGLSAGSPFAATFEGLDADRFYDLTVFGSDGTDESVIDFGDFYLGAVSVSKSADAVEATLTPGVFVFSRAATEEAMRLPLTVNYAVGGTARSGTDFEPLSGTAVIPAGESSVSVDVMPVLSTSTAEDVTVVVTVSAGDYLDSSSATAELTVVNYAGEAGVRIWAAKARGAASEAANWLPYGVPTSTDRIVLDGSVSNQELVWDAGVNGLPDTVAGWEQRANYVKTRAYIKTCQPGKGDFQLFTVTGDCTILGGYWSSYFRNTNDDKGEGGTYRLNVRVGGKMTIGSSGLTNTEEVKLTAYDNGYAKGTCASGSANGSHAASANGWDKVYGDVYRPASNGSGATGAGGGVISVEVGGDLELNGAIDVTCKKTDFVCAAAGSIFIKAAAVYGRGVLKASGNADEPAGDGGSGGRIAVELTGADQLGLGWDQVKVHGTCGRNACGGGTCLVKGRGQQYGTLFLDNVRPTAKADRTWVRPEAIPAVCPGETWTFDGIVIRRAGMLAVPTGTTLRLPNGPGSVRALADAGYEFMGGILAAGGGLDWGVEPGAPVEFDGGWVFQPASNVVFDCDVSVKSGGAIGCLLFRGDGATNDFTRCDLTVRGDLTVAAGGRILAKNRGPETHTTNETCVAHGGQGGALTAPAGYGSVFRPQYAGSSAVTTDPQAWTNVTAGGGAVRLEVTGALTVDGEIDARAVRGPAMGSGGSIDITAGTLAGSGTILAGNVFYMEAQTNLVAGGGGRIAIRLTGQDVGTDGFFAPNADYGGYARISAAGAGVYSSMAPLTVARERTSSAGTVYVQGRSDAEGAGRIVIANNNTYSTSNTTAYTSIPAAALGDAPAAFARAAMEVCARSKVRLTADLAMRKLTLANSSELDLAGRRLEVNRATVDGVRLAHGAHAAGEPELGVCVSDSAGGGVLFVRPEGTMLFVR